MEKPAESETELKHTALATIKDSMRYIVVSTADVDEYDNYAPTFQKMFDSIEIY